MIAVPDILFKPDSNKFTKFFFVHKSKNFVQKYKKSCIYANFLLILRREEENIHLFIALRAVFAGNVRDEMGPYYLAQ